MLLSYCCNYYKLDVSGFSIKRMNYNRELFVTSTLTTDAVTQIVVTLSQNLCQPVKNML